MFCRRQQAAIFARPQTFSILPSCLEPPNRQTILLPVERLGPRIWFGVGDEHRGSRHFREFEKYDVEASLVESCGRGHVRRGCRGGGRRPSRMASSPRQLWFERRQFGGFLGRQLQRKLRRKLRWFKRRQFELVQLIRLVGRLVRQLWLARQLWFTACLQKGHACLPAFELRLVGRFFRRLV